MPIPRFVVAIDPGNVKSAFIVWNGKEVRDKGILENKELLTRLLSFRQYCQTLCIEMVVSYNMRVGQTVFDTCVWIGRFQQQWVSTDGQAHLVYRREVKQGILGTPVGTDSDIIQTLKLKFGIPGTKKNPNPVTYGIVKDIWQAFALAVYWQEIQVKYPNLLR